jgi:hypothetical protein
MAYFQLEAEEAARARAAANGTPPGGRKTWQQQLEWVELMQGAFGDDAGEQAPAQEG